MRAGIATLAVLSALSGLASGADRPARQSPPGQAQVRPPLFPAAEVDQRVTRWMFLVFHGAPRDPVVGQAAANPFKLVSKIDPDGRLPQLRIDGASTGDVPPPERALAEQTARGLEKKDLDRLPTLSRTTFFGFAARVDPARSALKTSQELVLRVARAAGGYVLDGESEELFTPAAFETRRVQSWKEPIPAAREQISIHQYAGNHPPLMRSVTMGMAKLGLPDLVIEDAADTHIAGSLINLAAQRLVEGARPDRDGYLLLDVDAIANPRVKAMTAVNFGEGARHRTRVLAVRGSRDEGDAENSLLELWFGGTEVAQREMARAHSEVWGATDSIMRVRHDSDITAASARARKHVLEVLKPRFADGKQQLEELLVKVPFRTPTGGNEWMWMKVLRWDGKTVKGTLANDGIEIPQLRAGMRVEADEDRIFDYILQRADGTREGNETGPLLMRASEQ